MRRHPLLVARGCFALALALFHTAPTITTALAIANNRSSCGACGHTQVHFGDLDKLTYIRNASVERRYEQRKVDSSCFKSCG